MTTQVFGRDVPHTIVDEGASVNILSSISWQALGSTQLVPVTQYLLAFNRRASQLLGILPWFPITLGGKIVYIDVMVFHDLEYNTPIPRQKHYKWTLTSL